MGGNGTTHQEQAWQLLKHRLTHHCSGTAPFQGHLASREELMPPRVCPVHCVPLQPKQCSRHKAPLAVLSCTWQCQLGRGEVLSSVTPRAWVCRKPRLDIQLLLHHPLRSCSAASFPCSEANLLCVVIAAEKHSPYGNIIPPHSSLGLSNADLSPTITESHLWVANFW